jgi:hypothetical protein
MSLLHSVPLAEMERSLDTNSNKGMSNAVALQRNIL